MVDADATLRAAERVVGLLQSHGIRAVVIGAVALAAYRYVRFTEDLDLGIEADLPGMQALVSAFNSLRGTGVPVEAHFYQVGPHGSTMSPGDPQLGMWPDLMVKWLRVGGFLGGR